MWTSHRLTSSGTVISEASSEPILSIGAWELIEFPAPQIYYFTGHVYEESAPAVRDVYAYRRDTGALMSFTTSSGDGYYKLWTTYSGAHYIVSKDAPGGESYNLARLDSVIPGSDV